MLAWTCKVEHWKRMTPGESVQDDSPRKYRKAAGVMAANADWLWPLGTAHRVMKDIAEAAVPATPIPSDKPYIEFSILVHLHLPTIKGLQRAP